MWSLDLGELLQQGSYAPAQSAPYGSTSHPQRSVESVSVVDPPCANWAPSFACSMADVAALHCTVPELSAVYQFRTWKVAMKRPRLDTAGEDAPFEDATTVWRRGFLESLSVLQHHPRWSHTHQGRGRSVDTPASAFSAALDALATHMAAAPAASVYSVQTLSLVAELLHYHLSGSSSAGRGTPNNVRHSTPEDWFAGIAWKRFTSLPFDATHPESWLALHERGATAMTQAVYQCSCSSSSGNDERENNALRCNDDTAAGNGVLLDALLSVSQGKLETGDWELSFDISDCTIGDMSSSPLCSSFLGGALLTSFVFPFLAAQAQQGHHQTHSSQRLCSSMTPQSQALLPMHLSILLDAFESK